MRNRVKKWSILKFKVRACIALWGFIQEESVKMNNTNKISLRYCIKVLFLGKRIFEVSTIDMSKYE